MTKEELEHILNNICLDYGKNFTKDLMIDCLKQKYLQMTGNVFIRDPHFDSKSFEERIDKDTRLRLIEGFRR